MATIHLHWLYFRGPRMMRGLTSGYTLCGHIVDVQALTAHRDDANCGECFSAARTREAREAADVLPTAQRGGTRRKFEDAR